MKSKKSSDWPPKGWKVQIKLSNGRNVKCYVHSKTGRKFYSKLAVLRYIKDQSVGKHGSHMKRGHAKTISGKKQMHPLGANDSFELPPGWIIEYRTRKSGPKEGTKYKCFIDPSTGNKFFSNPEVYRYLEILKRSTGSSEQKEGGSIRHSSGNMSVDPLCHDEYDLKSNVSQTSTSEDKRLSSEARKIVVERTIDEELPSGWVKEMRCKMRENKVVRRDPFYFDPGSGLVFRSKLEALRYVETGEISRHAYRRKNGKNINSKAFTVGKTSPTSSDEKGKTGSETRRLLSTDELSPKQSISRLSEAGGRRITRSFARVSPISVDQANLEQSALLPESVLPIVQYADGNEGDATRKQREPSTAPSTDMLMDGKLEDLALQGCSNGKTQSGKRKTKDGKSPSVPFRSSKRLAGVEAEVVFHSIPIEHARLATKRKSIKNKEAPRLGMIPSDSQERTQTLDPEPPNELGSQDQTRALDINAHTVLATQEESLNKYDSLTQVNANEMAQAKEQASLSFSRYPKSEVSQSSIIHSEDSTDTLPQGKIEIEQTVTEVQPDRPAGRKIEDSLEDCPILEDQPGSVERDTEFCYPSPLWTDPCLEFAFKTLTGAIPLDDNLAVQDYIQHQLRTSKQSNNDRSTPDMGVPCFFENDEAKSVSPLQDVSFPNSNGFSSIKQVNDK